MNTCWKCGEPCAGVECEFCERSIPPDVAAQIRKGNPGPTPDFVKLDWSKVKTLEDFQFIIRNFPVSLMFLRNSPAHKLLERFC